MNESLWLAFGTLGATIVTMVGQLVFLVLRRRWETQDREDKAALAVKVEENRAVLAAKVEAEREMLARQVEAAALGVSVKLEENTAVNVEAIRVANNFATRLEVSNERWETLLGGVGDPVTEIKGKVEDIHDVVVEENGDGENADTA